LAKIGRDHIYSDMEKALCTVHTAAHRGSDEENCPLTSACQLPTTP
jgi:SulP family sulfate permease